MLQMRLLIGKGDSGNPLYLSIACEELRVFGEFRNLTKKITSLPDDLLGLLKLVCTFIKSLQMCWLHCRTCSCELL